MRLVYPWLQELVPVSAGVDEAARELGLRGFEVASIEHGPLPVIDFDITANRPDCLNHLGLAREASAVWRVPLQMPDMAMPDPGPAEPLDVRIEAEDLCPRYCAQVFEVAPGPSPEWLVNRLDAAGVRPISNVVDVTNYVMLEIGQPMHAFDLERLADRRLVIRRARPGERLQTLDGVDRSLDPGMLVIADAARASAVGGVMGGRESEVTGATRLIALESAYFSAPSVRRTSKRLGLRTEASIRFERGADINAPPAGIARAAALFAKMSAARPLGPMIDCYPSPRPPVHVRLRAARLARLLGQEIPDDEVPRILGALGFGVAEGRGPDERSWLVTVPSYRVDVTREADLIEEVGRHYGFDRLPMTFPALTAPQPPPDPQIGRERLARQILTASGFSEAVTFAFIEEEAAAAFAGGAASVAVANPLSEKFAVLRPSLLAGLLDSAVHNRRRERRDVRLFEIGSRFDATGERRMAAFVWTGAAVPEHWSAPARPVDFFDAKGVVEQLCAAFGAACDCVPGGPAFMIPGRTASLVVQRGDRSVPVGLVGQLLPEIADARGFPAAEPVFGAEIDLAALADAGTGDELRVQPLPRFPSIVRDISIVVDEALPAATVRGTIRSAAPPTLVSVVEFDRYRGKGVPEGRVSLSLRLTFRAPDRTLTDQEAQDATERIVNALGSAHGAQRR